MLAACQFYFSIRDKKILSGIDFELKPGERLAIIGPNGAGKSTLLKSFCRILPPGEGALNVAGKSLSAYTQKALARKTVGLMVGTVVSVAGPVGFIGLIVPHIARRPGRAGSSVFISCQFVVGRDFSALV